MKERLFKLLGIETGEESMISMLLTQSVFLGIFFGAFDISAHSLFLSIFDEKMMARGYVVSGFAGIILTSIYTALQARQSFRVFATMNLTFVTALTILLWLLLLISPSKPVVFLVFIMLGPLNILAMLGFWGTVGRLFTLRQGKRLFGLVDAGLVIGIIISCYAIPVLLSFNFAAHNILLISAAAILTGSVIQIVIGRRFLISRKDVESPESSEPSEPVKKKSVLTLFREDRYIRIMGLFIALSVMTAFFVQYSFMAVTREQYPAEEDMARFLGLFTGSMMIFTLLIKLLVFSYLIRNYGLRTCLAISPVLIASFTAIAVGIGMAMGFTPASNGFMIFFMILALSRLFSKSLKDSIESPSFKVIYQTIDEKIRFEVQSGMDGTTNEIAALSSGLILAGLGIISFIKLIHFSLVLMVIALLWIIVAVKLYNEYRNSIRRALETGGQSNSGRQQSDMNALFNNRVYADLAFQNEYLNLITESKKSFEKYGSNSFFSAVLGHADARKDINLIEPLKNISLNARANREIRERSATLAESLELNITAPQQKEDKILTARKILADSRLPQTTQILRLLRDNSAESKELALYMIGKFGLKDMIPEVCQCLSIPQLELKATAVLRSFGAGADEELRKYYMIASGNPDIARIVLRLLGEKCQGENENFLFTLLWSNSRQIKELALHYLIESGFRAPAEAGDRMHQLISDIIGVMVWNLSAKAGLRRVNDQFLLNILDKESERWNDFLFGILSITYDSRSVGRIRENLDSGTVASVNYALEMMDLVIDESVKPKLIPLLDIIPDEDKVKALYQFYPGEIPDYGKLTEDIINRDYNLLGIWTKACTIRNIAEAKDETLTESLAALLFSPETILQEEAAGLLARSGGEKYRQVSGRIPVQVKSRLDKILNGSFPKEEMMYEKIRFLRGCLKNTPEDYLISLAEDLKYLKEPGSDHLNVEGGFVLWSLRSDNDGFDVKIIYENPDSPAGKLSGSDFSFYYLLTLDSVRKYCIRFPEKMNDILNYIENN